MHGSQKLKELETELRLYTTALSQVLIPLCHYSKCIYIVGVR